MLSHYKTPLSRLGDPVARVLLQAHVRPNHLTVLGLGVSIVAAGALAGGRLRIGRGAAHPRRALRLLRRLASRGSPDSVSAFGAFLDSVVDRYSDLVVLLGIVLFYHRAADVQGVFLTMITADRHRHGQLHEGARPVHRALPARSGSWSAPSG